MTRYLYSRGKVTVHRQGALMARILEQVPGSSPFASRGEGLVTLAYAVLVAEGLQPSKAAILCREYANAILEDNRTLGENTETFELQESTLNRFLYQP